MDYRQLQKLREKLYFTAQDVAGIAGIDSASSLVLCTRYTKKGIFVRLKKNFYVLEQVWENFSREDFFRISNFLQVPSYISFGTALSRYGVTTQLQQDFFESACLKRSRKFDIKGVAFNFYKLKKEYYFGFVRENNIFIATKEKAFVDSAYLYSFGKYKIDFSAIDLGKLDRGKIREIIKVFPGKTKSIIKKLCKT